MRKLIHVLAVLSVILTGCRPDERSPEASKSLPGIPQEVVGLQEGARIEIRWQPVDQADEYVVFRATTGTLTKIANVTATAFIDEPSAPGVTLTYAVASLNVAGQSEMSPPISIDFVDIPGVPTELTAVQVPSGIALTWSEVEGASGYDVFRADAASGGIWVHVTSTSAGNYDDYATIIGAIYDYRVEAFNVAGNSDPSAVVSARVIPIPSTPSLTAGLNGSAVHLQWEASPYATQYEIYRGWVTGPTAWLATTNSIDYTDYTVAYGLAYQYRLRALNPAGTSPFSGAVTAVTAPLLGPDNLRSIGYETAVLLSWSPVAYATLYRVFRSDTPGGPYTLLGETADTTYADVGTMPGVPYWYIVRAVQLGHEGYDSETSATSPGFTTEVCLLNQQTATVDVFPVGANNFDRPAAAIGSQTRLDSSSNLAVHSGRGEYFVSSNFGSSLSVFSSSATGNAAPLRRIVGPATQLQIPFTIAVDEIHDEVFVNDNQRILVFSATATENAAPIRILRGSPAFSAYAIGFDTANDEVFFGSNGSIHVYSRTASGSLAPLRTLTGPSTGLPTYIDFMAVDSVHGELYVAATNSLKVYATGASGDTAPVRSITSFLPFQSMAALAVDSAAGELYIAGYSSVIAVARTASGANVVPLRSGPLPYSTTLSFDSARNELVAALYARSVRVLDAPTLTSKRFIQGHIVDLGAFVALPDGKVAAFDHADRTIKVFPSGANAASAPVEQLPLSGSAVAMSFDLMNDELYVAYNNAVEVFQWPVAPNAFPTRTLSGAATGLGNIQGIAVDPLHGELFVATGGTGIRVFDRTQNGNALPKRTLINALMLAPTAIWFDPIDKTLWATSDNYIAAFARDASGTIAPLEDFTLPAYYLSNALGLWLRRETNELFIAENFLRVFGSDHELQRTLFGDEASNFWDIQPCTGW